MGSNGNPAERPNPRRRVLVPDKQSIEELKAQMPKSGKMRLRVLELPQQKRGDAIETPFMFVLDRCPVEAHAEINELMNHGQVVNQLGARGTLVFAEEVELS